MFSHHKSILPHGAAFEHGKAHQAEHQSWDRRRFLKNLGMTGAGAMLLGRLPVTAMHNSPLGQALAGTSTDRILVLIRLKGGNDGLNTIIPIFDYGTYQNLRPSIAIPQNQILQLDDDFGIPAYMEPIQRMWQDGQMKVAHSVGYPEQNLSHFRSSDIWASASDSNVLDSSGWLGRFLNDSFPDFLTNPPENPPAIQIGGTGNVIFNNANMINMAVIVNSPEELARIAEDGQLYNTQDVPECHYGDQLSYVRSVANSTFKYADIISQAYEKGKNTEEYQNFGLGQQLALVAKLIKGGLQTKLYMVTIDGFDTHAEQNNTHPFLMNYLADSVRKFYDDLAESDLANRVLSMSISEFGRRIEQNASAGTDHGAAAPMLLFGPGLEGNGFIGEKPDFSDLDEVGNLKYNVDFRSVYSTLLENWLCIDAETVDQIMGQRFPRVAGLGISCLATSTNRTKKRWSLEYTAVYQGGVIQIDYRLPASTHVKVSIFDIHGKKIADLHNGYQYEGMQSLQFRPPFGRLASAYYIIYIDAGRYVASERLPVLR